MTTRALQFDPQKSTRDDLPFGSKRGIIVRGDAKTRAATFVLTSAEQNQLSDHAIQWLVVTQGVVQKPSKRAGRVQTGIDQCRVFGQHVLPVTHPMIRPALIGQKLVDDTHTLIG